MSTPVAYLRRSSANTSNGAGRISYAVQESSVLELARRHGEPEPEILTEWGRSGAAVMGAFGGTNRGGKRRAYLLLRERIKAGEVSVLYAYSLSRLARSTRELLDLAEACAESGTAIRLAKEGTIDFTTPSGRLYLTVLSGVATFEAEVSRERAMDRVANAREAGRYLGAPPTGWELSESGRLVHGDRGSVEAVMAAFAETGTYRRAAQLLNESGDVKPPKAARWSPAVVRTIVSRESGTRTAPTRRGSRTHPTEPLSRLLICSHCRGMLTSTRQRYTTNSGPALHRAWRCYRSNSDSTHPRPVEIAEARILPLLQAEAGRLRVPHERVRLAQERIADLAALDVRRARLVDALEAGTLTRAELEPRLAAIEVERGALENATAGVDVPKAVDWTWPAERLAPVLSSLWRAVTVNLATGTVSAEWTVPEWRAP